jgi:phosphoglycerate dehydrogenase-like enzyme
METGLHIIINAPLPAEQEKKLRALAPRMRLTFVPHGGTAIPTEALRDAEIVYTDCANFDPADAPRLRFVQTNSAATNPFRQSKVSSDSTPVANVTGAYSVAVAECAMGMLLAVTRKITLGCRFQAESRWADDYDPWVGVDLYGMTMGIVGYGSIGRQIARLAQGFGMTVLACKRRPEKRTDDSYLLPGTGDPEGRIPKAWFGEKQIAELFRQSDVAMVALPDVPTTQQRIGRSELVALPRHAYFVNVGRGAVVDEPALIECLCQGKLAGAALDVFAEEPLPAISPLWKMENVLIMPHIASWTTAQTARAAEVLIENVRRHLNDEPLINLIDKKLLY